VDHDEARKQLISRVNDLRRQHGWSQADLAAAAQFSHPPISKFLGGHKPSRALVEALEKLSDVPDELVRLYECGWEGRPYADQDSEGADDTNRREFTFSGAGTAAMAFFRGSAAREPDAMEVGLLRERLYEHARELTTRPHAELAPRVFTTYRSARRHLDASAGRIRAQNELGALAGYSAYMLCRLAFNVGKPTISRQFVTEAMDLGDQLDDPLLIGSAYGMISTLDFYGGDYPAAVRAAQEGRARASHPYTRGRLYAWEARARALRGDNEGARDALDAMSREPTETRPRPGDSPLTPGTANMLRARTLVRLDAGEEAAPLAQDAISALSGAKAVPFEDLAGAYNSMAGALVRRRHPEPDGAVDYVTRALAVYDKEPSTSTMIDMTEVAGALAPYAKVAAVRDFREHLADRRRPALP
jgi:transcriptional regulator with XRE-family HTH domain